MVIHQIKCWTEYFDALIDGTKTFEVRKDDRGYQVGDTLLLQEWGTVPYLLHADHLTGVAERDDYTGRICIRRVTYVLRGRQFGIENGYVVMGLAEMEGDANAVGR